jgi:hypothetical protein
MLKGIAVALAVFFVGFVVLFVAFMVAAGGVAVDVKVIVNVGQFILGLGLGTSACGVGLWFLGRLAASYLTRRMAG